MNEIKISGELANAILGYLATKPFNEVYQLIGGLQQVGSGQSISKGSANMTDDVEIVKE